MFLILLRSICYMFSDMLFKESHILIYILDILKIGYIVCIEKWASWEKKELHTIHVFCDSWEIFCGLLSKLYSRNCPKKLQKIFIAIFHCKDISWGSLLWKALTEELIQKFGEYSSYFKTSSNAVSLFKE